MNLNSTSKSRKSRGRAKMDSGFNVNCSLNITSIESTELTQSITDTILMLCINCSKFITAERFFLD